MSGKPTKIHGYKKHIVSEFLKDRHPYLEPPFKDREDPTEVFHAVFDRSIPKLVEILSFDDELPSQNYREALMLLNQMSSHQENKDMMISHLLVFRCLNFMRHKDSEVRREATLLLGIHQLNLGSLVSTRRGRECLDGPDLENWQEILMCSVSDILSDDEIQCREVCGWMLCRLTSGRDGVDILVHKHTDIIKYMIISFTKHSKAQKKEEAPFLVYLLETMTNIMYCDEGVEFFNGTGVMKRYNEILLNEETPFDEFDTRIRYLCLKCTALMSAHPEGREEAISYEVILTANRYLTSEYEHLVNNAVRVIMFSAIHLKGKPQAISDKDDIIIINLIELLKSSNEDVVANVRHALVVIADLPKGFKVIVKYLSKYVEHLESIFGPTSILPLYSLLFRAEKPPFMNEETREAFTRYASCIAHFINNKDHEQEALQYSIEKTCRITQRMIPMMLDTKDGISQERIARAVIKICDQDEVNRIALRLVSELYGDIMNPLFNTTINIEIAKFQPLQELLKRAKEEGRANEELTFQYKRTLTK